MGNVCSISVPSDAITSRCLDYTARKATYISELEDNVVALQTAMQNLIEARNDVMRRVTVAEQQQMIRLNQVQLWLSRVQQMETTVGDLIIKDSSQEIDKLCFGGFCSKDCKSSYKFGKKVSKMIKAVTTLMADGANFQEVAERVPEAAVDEIPHEPTLVGLQSTLDKVWRCLAQEEEEDRENVLIQAGVGLTEAPKIGKWEGVTRVSLMDNEIEYLFEFEFHPTTLSLLKCSHLTTLFLQSNSLMTIDSYLLKFMPSLKVLNLSSNLSLNELSPGISKLVSLQYLNLSKTSIRELPIELKALVNLKCLNLEDVSYLRKIPRQLISSFSMLQVLRMFNHYSQGLSQDGYELLVEELLCLKYINVLTITLKSSDALGRFLSSSKLRSCTQSLSLQEFSDSKSLNVLSLAYMKHLHTLHLKSKYLEELKIGGAQEVQSIREAHGFRSLHTFHVCSCGKLRDLTWLVFAQNLKFLTVSNCSLMEEIISAREIGQQVLEMMGNLFGKLESLKLMDLQHLKSIYCNALPFLHLKDMKVHNCPNLKKLPLDSNSTKERKIVIKGEEGWWKELQWEDEATQNAFLPCFKSHSSS
ncbi:hypothetical protein EZV62_004131 [Acer yangbiense]|uniref:Disease resistance protein At4g27190-like leucine-rich repeats domain-containing protein n=1 Tax=Acer yangbiense TaxID=1000413 RepID=A0A5C7IL48_9ROSI|nr:hypothetical protein EZV62_004131 [Acer yangbiense]